MKYYKITASGGHMGAGNIIPLTFYFKAKNMHDAIKQARSMPCVKHDKTDAITNAKEISKEEYEQSINGYSAYDVYNNR
jgi:hypothetical protein